MSAPKTVAKPSHKPLTLSGHKFRLTPDGAITELFTMRKKWTDVLTPADRAIIYAPAPVEEIGVSVFSADGCTFTPKYLSEAVRRLTRIGATVRVNYCPTWPTLPAADAKGARCATLAPGGTPRWMRIYDNGGETADRYTVVFTGKVSRPNGFPYRGMSRDPYSPQGFGQWGDGGPNAWCAVDCLGKASGREYVWPPAVGRKNHLGTRIEFHDLPYACQHCVWCDYADLWDIPMPGYFTDHRAALPDRLEYLRRELRAERISLDEIHELQSLAAHIHPSDVELLEAAGVPEKH